MNLKIQKQTRQKRVRQKVKQSGLPRLSIFRSNIAVYAQIIDDSKGQTLVSASEKQLKEHVGTKSERAKAVGLLLAKQAKEKKITRVVFDRGSYAYHGRVKNLADGAREGGLQF